MKEHEAPQRGAFESELVLSAELIRAAHEGAKSGRVEMIQNVDQRLLVKLKLGGLLLPHLPDTVDEVAERAAKSEVVVLRFYQKLLWPPADTKLF